MAWTNKAKHDSGDENATADLTNFDTAVEDYGKARENKYATTYAGADGSGDGTASTDGDSANGESAAGDANQGAV